MDSLVAYPEAYPVEAYLGAYLVEGEGSVAQQELQIAGVALMGVDLLEQDTREGAHRLDKGGLLEKTFRREGAKEGRGWETAAGPLKDLLNKGERDMDSFLLGK